MLSEDGTAVLWGNQRNLRIPVDPLIPREELRCALFCMECAEDPLDVAFVRWQTVSRRVALQLLYETLVAHGVATHPPQAEALRGWDELHAGGPLVAVGGVQTVPALEDLTADGLNEGGPVFSHLWAVVRLCRFPAEALRRCHAALSMDMRERLAHLSPGLTGPPPTPPVRPTAEPLVRAYSVEGTTAPLLLCPPGRAMELTARPGCRYQAYRPRVLAMLREFLHVVYAHVAEVRAPPPHREGAYAVSGTSVSFPAAAPSTWWPTASATWPSSRAGRPWRPRARSPGRPRPLAQAVVPERRATPLETLERWSNRLGRDPERRCMHTCEDDDESGGPAVLWLGPEAFLYVAGGGSTLTGGRPPARWQELPGWVLGLLEEVGGAPDALRAQVDACLQRFAEAPVAPVVRLLRRVQWALLPLQWRPVYVPNLPVHIPRRESARAHERLAEQIMREAAPADVAAADIVAVLGRLTGGC